MARPFIPVVNTLKVEMRYTLFGQQCENVFYVDRGEQAVQIAIDALGPVLVSWWDANMKAHTSRDVSLNSIKITDMSAADGPTLLYTSGLPLAGTYAGDALPSNVSLAVKLNSSYRGRNSTGRQFLVGIYNGIQEGNLVGAGGVALIKAAYEVLLDDLTTSGFLLEVVSFVLSKVFRTTGLKSPVASISVDNVLDSQRRRLTGRGR
jgi:hypothetical protein